jgi:hypothetical protein
VDVRAEFERVWPFISAGLECQTGGNPYDIEELFELFLKNEVLLWPSANAAVLCSTAYYPRSKHLVLWSIGGNLKEILRELRPQVETWAKENGYSHVMGFGRRQWTAVANRNGYSNDNITSFSKTL